MYNVSTPMSSRKASQYYPRLYTCPSSGRYFNARQNHEKQKLFQGKQSNTYGRYVCVYVCVCSSIIYRVAIHLVENHKLHQSQRKLLYSLRMLIVFILKLLHKLIHFALCLLKVIFYCVGFMREDLWPIQIVISTVI